MTAIRKQKKLRRSASLFHKRTPGNRRVSCLPTTPASGGGGGSMRVASVLTEEVCRRQRPNTVLRAGRVLGGAGRAANGLYFFFSIRINSRQNGRAKRWRGGESVDMDGSTPLPTSCFHYMQTVRKRECNSSFLRREQWFEPFDPSFWATLQVDWMARRGQRKKKNNKKIGPLVL